MNEFRAEEIIRATNNRGGRPVSATLEGDAITIYANAFNSFLLCGELQDTLTTPPSYSWLMQRGAAMSTIQIEKKHSFRAICTHDTFRHFVLDKLENFKKL